MGAGLTVSVLGPVEARGAAGVIPVSGRKLQVLLASLALAAPHPVSDDRLIEEIWGDDQPANPANSLQAQVSQLRRLLGRDVVARSGAGYALVLEPGAVDSTRLDEIVAAARAATEEGDHRGAAQLLRSALALVRGPILGDLLDHEVLRAAAASLEERVLAVHEALGDCELAAGRHAEVVASLSELVQAHPLRERFAAQLITALYRCGRQIDALQAYATVRASLIEEFGVEPGPELKQLEAAVLAHDAALAAPASSAPASPVPGAAPHDKDAFLETRGRLPLVGRDEELAAVRTDLADVHRGRGRAVVLVGEPGIGKTRLAEEVAAEADRSGAVVGWGRSHDGWGDVAFRPWGQIVATLVERLPHPVVVDALGRGAAEIAQIAPAVHDAVPDLPPLPPLDPETSRTRVAEALIAFLRAVSRDRPLVVTLDDIQWADAASLHLLGCLAREIADARILVLATYRSVGAPAGSHLAEALAMLVRQPVVRRIDLDGLDRTGLAALIEASGAEPDPDVLTTVLRRTQGNPFFAVEVLRLLPERVGHEDATTLRSAIPSGVREVVRQRVQLLPESAAELVAAIAVLDGRPRLTTLARVAGIDTATLLDRLEPALAGGIVLASEDLTAVRLSHGLVGETVEADLSLATRARLHQRAAEAIEAEFGDTEGPHLVDVATHWARAVPLAPVEPAIDAAVRAAAWAEQHLAHDQAEASLRSALDLIATLPAGRARDERELRVLDRLNLVQIVTVGYGPEVSERMRQLCLAVDDKELLVPALWRLATHACLVTDMDRALALGEQLMALSGDDDSTPTALAGHLVMGTVHNHRGEAAAGRRHLDRATEMMAAGTGTALHGLVAETPEVWCGAFSSWNWWMVGEPDRAEEVVLATCAAADAAGNPYGSVFAQWFSVLIATLRREPDAVLARCERAVEEAARGGFGMFVPYMLVSRGWAVATLGDGEVGCDELVGAADSILATGTRMMAPVFPAFLADACLTDGRPADALAATAEGLAQQELTGERWWSSELHRLRGVALAALDPADPEARAAVEQAVAVASQQGASGLRARAEATLAELVSA